MKSELLAPAGSYESMKAAYAAGADAVYIGGSRFGARAYADNLDEEMMRRAIDYAHVRNKKIYLTVNTLLKDSELESLYEYLNPFYKEGLDAVIVQDFGVVNMMKETFPEMEIHASTQMNITSEYGAKLLKNMGASRIVTARELSLEEIRIIHDKVDIEIESFIHGALCYCYSGQCLLSSMLGGRSGNRGRCAQPCRLPYELHGQGKDDGNGKYLLSPKDICTLDILPDILESGVYSLKIEGRMKKPEYTAGVVSIYRKYLDIYEKNGKKDYFVSREDKNMLLDLYNRGGFSTGYYRQHNGPDMMSVQRPNHQGTKAAKIISADNRCLKLQALETLHSGDVLEVPEMQNRTEIVLQNEVRDGKIFSIKRGRQLSAVGKGNILFRTRSEQLLKILEKDYISTEYLEKINGKLILSKRKPAILNLVCQNCSVSVTGANPEEAKNRPLSQKDVEKQICKTGGSGFFFESLQIEMENDLFMPLQSLNELRRNGLAELESRLLQMYQRQDGKNAQEEYLQRKNRKEENSSVRLAVSLEHTDAVGEICKTDDVDSVYIDCNAFECRNDFAKQGKKFAALCKNTGKKCFYIMPWIFRQKAAEYYLKDEVWQTLSHFDGVLLRNQDEYLFLRAMGYKGEMAADWNLYTWNRKSQKFWRDNGIVFDTISPELNRREIIRRGCSESELIVYGHQPLMVSAQCQIKNICGCTGKPQILTLKDRKKKEFAVKNNCQFCYNTIYNGVVTELIDCAESIRCMGLPGIRLQFTTEGKEKILSVIHRYADAFKSGYNKDATAGEFTRGHFERGVE
ncbi:MAG: DUF3656 domain-containing protein [Eubacteriales bacterium]|nr:DUF3656 domain-containing protein [Eubacteriales bacterium]